MKNLNHLMYFALLFSGLILITGCSEMEAPTAANAGQQSLLKSSDAAGGVLITKVNYSKNTSCIYECSLAVHPDKKNDIVLLSAD